MILENMLSVWRTEISVSKKSTVGLLGKGGLRLLCNPFSSFRASFFIANAGKNATRNLGELYFYILCDPLCTFCRKSTKTI